MALWAGWQCASERPQSLAGPRCEAGLVGAVWVVPSPQFPTSPQHQRKWATKDTPLLNAPLGNVNWSFVCRTDRNFVSRSIWGRKKIKSTGFPGWHRAARWSLLTLLICGFRRPAAIVKEGLNVFIYSEQKCYNGNTRPFKRVTIVTCSCYNELNGGISIDLNWWNKQMNKPTWSREIDNISVL